MRLACFDDDRAGVVVEDHVLDLTAAAAGEGGGPPLRVPDLCQMGLVRALELVERLQAGAPARPLADVRLRAPIGRPGLIAAAPINYGDHQLEMRQQYDVSGLGIFLKAPSSVIGPGDDIQLPYHDRRFDHEGELAVVVGANTRRSVPVEEARSLVFGYTCLLDITMRGGEDRSTRKSFDTFTPIGPWIVTADELTDPGALEVTCLVNGTVRQHASTSTLIWDVDRLLGYVSSVLTLSAGDVVSTGTPAGVGPIEAGDRVEVTITGIGTLAVGVTDQGAVASPTRGANHGPVAPPAPPLRSRLNRTLRLRCRPATVPCSTSRSSPRWPRSDPMARRSATRCGSAGTANRWCSAKSPPHARSATCAESRGPRSSSSTRPTRSASSRSAAGSCPSSRTSTARSSRADGPLSRRRRAESPAR